MKEATKRRSDEATKGTFAAYRPDFERSANVMAWVDSTYGRTIPSSISNDEFLSISHAQAECVFDQFSRPYCKVFPRMETMLAHVDVNIPWHEFAMPFPAFEVCLQDRAFLFFKHEGNGQQHSFFRILGNDGSQWTIPISGMTIEDGFRASESMVKDPGINTDLPRRLFRIAICTALFMVDGHRMVCPDLEPRMIRSERRRQKSNRTRSVFKPRAAALTLGREIELPRPVTQNDPSAGDGPGHSLKHCHMRRGHLRHQACGEGLKERKLIFVMPMIIRPDLPPGEFRQGYFIPGNGPSSASPCLRGE